MAGEAVNRPARVCAFCGADGPLTREHVLRDRFNALLPTGSGRRRDVASYRDRSGPWRFVEREYPGQAYSSAVRAVCANCNNGWMEQLETKVEQDLLAIVRGEAVTLADDRLTDLALWAVKTTLVRRLADPDDGEHLPRRHYERVRAGQVPPGTLVLATSAQCALDGPLTRSTTAVLQYPGLVLTSLLLMVTLHIEHAMLFVSVPSDTLAGQHQLRAWERMVSKPWQRLWPVDGAVQWPTEGELRAEHFDTVPHFWASVLTH